MNRRQKNKQFKNWLIENGYPNKKVTLHCSECGKKLSFNRDDFDLIYTELGNATNPELTEKFIDSDYDLKVLEEE